MIYRKGDRILAFTPGFINGVVHYVTIEFSEVEPHFDETQLISRKAKRKNDIQGI